MKIVVTQIKSIIGHQETHKRVIKSLGLGKIGRSRIHDDNPVIRGMIHKVSFLVKVEPLSADQTSGK